MMKKLLCFLLLLPISFVCMAQEVEIRVHEVQRGESLEHVAARYGITVEELNSYNLFLDKYFYVGQKLNVPIKIVPKVAPAYSTHNSYSEPVKKKRKGNGLGRIIGNSFAAAFGYHPYAQPQMYSPNPSYGGGFGGGSGNMDYLLNPNIALMQAQQQMAQEQMLNQQLMNLSLQQVYEQEEREFQHEKQFRPNLTIEQFRQEKAQMHQIMKEAERQGTSEERTPYGKVSSSKGHQCRVCGGSGLVVDNTYLGYASQTKWCDICRKEVYVAHRHKSCKTCGGEGWISGY